MESLEMLEDLDPCLLSLEEDFGQGRQPDNETINKVFRIFHSIKGSASYLMFENITEVTHELESLLDLVRKQIIPLETTP